MPRVRKLTSTRARARMAIGAAIGLLIGGIVASLRETTALDGMEMRLVDARTRTYVGSRAPDPGIVMAVVNSEDVAAVRDVDPELSWPWPLYMTTWAFEWLAATKPRAIVVDMYQFDRGTGPDETPVELTGNRIEYFKAQAEFADGLRAAFEKAGTVVLAMDLSEYAPEGGDRAAALRKPVLDEIASRWPSMRTTTRLKRPIIDLPVVRLLRGAKSLGFATAVIDSDGVARRACVVAEAGGRLVPSLPLAGAFVAQNGGEVVPGEVRVGGAVQKISDEATFYLSFRGGTDSYARVRPSDILAAGQRLEQQREQGIVDLIPEVGSATIAAVRGKIVMWGVNAQGFKDVISAPVDENFPGPEYQATVLDNLLHGDGRVPASRGANLAILLGMCGLLGAGGATARKRGLVVSVTVLLGAVLWLWSYRLFREGTSIDLFSPSLGILLTYAAVTGFKALTEGRQNKWLEGTFSQYLSPAVIDSLKKDPTRLELSGRDRELTISFSDVKGFTTISEGLESNDLVRLLNDYLTRQSDCVLAEDGVIDKFIGDAVMSFFGDPIAHADHALRACRMAIRSLEALKGTQPLARELGVGILENRTGIATGLVTVGNMGSEKRFNYTVMGDTVNLASRLEGANKSFGSRILLSDGTYQQVAGKVVAKPLARLVVVGKSEPVAVYELLGIVGEAPESLVRHAEAFAAAYAALLADDLDAAEAHVDRAAAERPEDPPCEWMRERIRALRRGARPRPWDGIYILESK